MHRLALTVAIASTLAASPAFAARLTAGPMVGATDMHTTTLWLQGDGPARATVDYWPLPAGGTEARAISMPKARSAPVRLERAEDFSGRIRLADLQPGTRYAYRLRLDGRPVGSVQHFTTQTRWQWRDKVDPPDISVVAGSCSYFNDPPRDRDGKPFGAGEGIFSAMAARQPDLVLWLGDNVYLRENETTSPEGMAWRYRSDRAQPALQPLLRVGQHAAIWDDHDFGPDDSNASFTLKQASLDLFRRYWANPSHGLPGVPGIFTTFSFSDVDFFLLDNRWYRDADRARGLADKTQFGAAQLRWLQNALLMSTATFKVVVGGSQFLNDASQAEGWAHYPQEQQGFLDWLALNRVDGVLFLSGDRHFSELSRRDRAGTYPLHDLTCSPLTAASFARPQDRDRPGQVEGTMVVARNFCSLAVQGPRQQRVLTMRVHDSEGRELWSRSLDAQALRTPKGP